MARVKFIKWLESFEFGYQPSIDRKQVQQLASCHFIEHGDKVVVLGPPGVGRTHLAVSLGLKVIETAYRMLFISEANLIAALSKGVCRRPTRREAQGVHCAARLDHRRDRLLANRPR